MLPTRLPRRHPQFWKMFRSILFQHSDIYLSFAHSTASARSHIHTGSLSRISVQSGVLLLSNRPAAVEVHGNTSLSIRLPLLSFSANSRRKRGRRKRKLFVDQKKELSNDTIKEQLTDFSDLIVPMDLAPPTEQLMLWKESGGAHSLFTQPCSTVLAPQINAVSTPEECDSVAFQQASHHSVLC